MKLIVIRSIWRTSLVGLHKMFLHIPHVLKLCSLVPRKLYTAVDVTYGIDSDRKNLYIMFNVLFIKKLLMEAAQRFIKRLLFALYKPPNISRCGALSTTKFGMYRRTLDLDDDIILLKRCCSIVTWTNLPMVNQRLMHGYISSSAVHREQSRHVNCREPPLPILRLLW